MKRILVTILFALLATGMASAQNLLDNDAYKKAVQLRDQAQQALSSGNFDQAQQLSSQSEVYAKQAVELAQQMALGYRATNWLDRAKERIAYAESVKAADRFPQDWNSAQKDFADAQQSYTAKKFENSISASQAVVAALARLTPVPVPVVAANVLPEYYKVRLIPNRRDCFWRIAEYPFVYGDPLKWKILYEANRKLLQDPNNPNLIQPGMIFTIPSVNGEKRSGTYNPDAAKK